MPIVFGRDVSLVLRTHEISLCKNNSHDLHRVITHSLVLIKLFMNINDLISKDAYELLMNINDFICLMLLMNFS